MSVEQPFRIEKDRNIILELFGPKYLSYVDRMQKLWSAYFQKQLPLWIAEAENNVPITLEKIEFDDDLYRRMYADVYDLLDDVYGRAGGVQLGLDLGEVQTIGINTSGLNFSIVSLAQQAYVTTRTGELIKGINETTQKDVQQIIFGGIEQQKNLKQISDDIYNKFKEYTVSRSELIAQQEIALASESAKYTQFREDAAQINTVGRKKNQDQGDNRVRETHMQATSAGRILANKVFPSTGMLHAPHGFRCRCVTVYRLFLTGENPNFSIVNP